MEWIDKWKSPANGKDHGSGKDNRDMVAYDITSHFF